MKAHPDLRPVRTRIREQSRWAKKVVIATDPDAAGDAIAYGIAKQLNRFNISLLRTNIQGLSPTIIERDLDSARTLDSEGLLKRLENRYLVNKKLQKIPWSLPGKFILPTLVLLYLLFNDLRHIWFIDRKGYKYKTPEGIKMTRNNSISASETRSTIEEFEIYHPLTTATALELFEQITEKQSFKELQDGLNRLFTTMPKSIGKGLISYPRTASQGFWVDTWSQFRRQWITSNTLETFRPPPIQQIPHNTAAHESIHPLHLDNTPARVRPHLRKFQYEMYRHLYFYHKKLLSAPASYQAQVLTTSEGRKRLYSVKSQINTGNQPIMLKPYISIGDLLNQLMKYKAIRPSLVGTYMDYLFDNSLIIRDRFGNAHSGSGLEALRRDIHSPTSLKKLINYIKSNIDQSIDPEMISHFIDDIFEKRGL